MASPKRDEREVGLELLERAKRVGGETVVGDKGYAGCDFAAAAADLDATIVRPARKDEPRSGLHLAPIRQWVEAISWTLKDVLTLERHGARTLHHLRRASPSTTNSVVRAGRWSTTWPEVVESTI